VKPGDEFTEAWVKRGEELLAIAPETRTAAQTEELQALQARAQAEQHAPESEVAAAYLRQQEARSAREREEAFLTVLKAAGRVLGSVGLAMLKAELTKATNSPEVPPTLAPVLRAVEAAALGAAETLAGDLTT